MDTLTVDEVMNMKRKENEKKDSGEKRAKVGEKILLEATRETSKILNDVNDVKRRTIENKIMKYLGCFPFLQGRIPAPGPRSSLI